MSVPNALVKPETGNARLILDQDNGQVESLMKIWAELLLYPMETNVKMSLH